MAVGLSKISERKKSVRSPRRVAESTPQPQGKWLSYARRLALPVLGPGSPRRKKTLHPEGFEIGRRARRDGLGPSCENSERFTCSVPLSYRQVSERASGSGGTAVAGAQVASTPSVSRAVFLSQTSRCRTMRKWPTPTTATGPTCNKGASGGAAQSAHANAIKHAKSNECLSITRAPGPK